MNMVLANMLLANTVIAEIAAGEHAVGEHAVGEHAEGGPVMRLVESCCPELEILGMLFWWTVEWCTAKHSERRLV